MREEDRETTDWQRYIRKWGHMQLIPSRPARRRHVVVLTAFFILAIGLGTVFVAFAADQSTFFACLNKGGVLTHVSITGASTCSPGETLVSWNQVGPPGPTGATGATGPSGPTGPSG